jgi:RNA polymerase sigma-70 factor (ECF subfamily)
MSKRVSKAASLELTFLAALESIHAGVDTSEIAEIQDWSRAVRGKFHGASVKDASDLPTVKTGLPSALEHANATNQQYSEMAIPQLIAVCTSEPSEKAWHEFVRRYQPVITGAVAKALHRSGKFSYELVDDLTQDVFLKLCHANFRVLRRVETRHENAFVGFLKVVASNTAQDYFRNAASSARASKPDRISFEFVSSPHAAFESEGRIALAEIDRALKTLSHEPNFERDYEIFWLYYRDGLTAKAIAALPRMKLSVKGVESTLLRLTRRIKTSLT